MFTTPVLALVVIMSAKTVAVPNVTGPKKVAPAEVQRAIQEALEEGGFTTIGEAALRRAEKKAGRKMDRLEAAKAAGAELLAAVEVEKSGTKYYVTAELTDCESGELVLSARYPVGSKKGAAETAGHALGAMLARAVEHAEAGGSKSAPGDDESEETAEEEAPKPAKKVAKTKAVTPKEEREVAQTAATIVPRDEDPTAAASATVRVDSGKFMAQEDRPLRLSASLGSRVSSNYAVLSQGEVTGLGYSLSPQAMVSAEARIAPFETPIALEIGMSYAALKYKLDIMPAPTPAEPSGYFVDVRASVAYSVDVASWSGGEFALVPLAGIHYQALGVDKQEPFDVILSSASVAPRAGARLALRVGDAVMIEGEGVLRMVASYEETPTKSGTGGSGFGATVGARARWWATDHFGFFAGAEYDYLSVALSGPATRTTFSGDPALENASVYHSQLTLALGAAVAL